MNKDFSFIKKKLEEFESTGNLTSIIAAYCDIKNDSIEENTKTLLNYGWYIPGDIEVKKVSEVIDLIKTERTVEADSIMVNFFKKNLISIEENLIQKHNERKAIIKEAFKAHNSNMFYSSTILFLSQGDGIMDGKIFHNRKNLEKHLDKEKNPSFVEFLKEDSSLNVPSIKVKNSKYFSKLNRHSVMHGQSVDYGTEINSLKALSLCCFASDWYNRYNNLSY
ncbi:hypothetical protein [Lacinutrix sp. Bg11-31]|uniref:hypothetical protein n=1 Tax=Lacinutrix sp. Bg11-31 TaxID=2057808 RepID=UPI000C3064B0|nr:hypothetical protein [Lacinutrix sp. Bg11-31]AUC81049.1 hypothetical protein CW733_02435 [Lacinutrix sp. Bg11-31]